MGRRRRKVVFGLFGLLLAGALASLLLWHRAATRPITLTGAVIRQDSDPSKQVPISDASITVGGRLALHGTKSDSSGLFRLTLLPGVTRGQMVTLRFDHAGYKPLVLTEPAGGRLYIARMSPLPEAVQSAPAGPPVSISNVTVRYTLRTESSVNVGTAVKTFEVPNTGNVPCNGQSPCSPDGKWKAAVASVTLDAGDGNQFRRPRVSCIAGPCPFTRIDSDQLSEDGRTMKISVRDWSSPATFLAQAEVVRQMSENVVRRLYPVIFGHDLNFTLPAEAEGPSFEADVNGSAIVFPLGPDLCLTWADCHFRTDQDHTGVYRCELKPGYRFR